MSQYAKQYRKQRILKMLATSANSLYKNGKITAGDLFRIAKKQRMRCALTGQKLTADNISLDHIIPRSKGGLNIPTNIRFVLKPINIARQTMTDSEFLNLCRGVVNFSALGGTPLTGGVK